MKRRSKAPGVVPFLTNAEVRAMGRWTGGSVRIKDKTIDETIELRGKAFAVLATLMVVAKHGRDPTGDNSSEPSGFLTDTEIADLTLALGRVHVGVEQVKKHISKIRKALTALWRDGRKGEHWANRVMESSGSLGYRLSTPAANVHLEILPDLADGQKFRDLMDDGRLVLIGTGAT